MRPLHFAALLALPCAAACTLPYRHLPTAPPLAFSRADGALRRGQYAAAEEGFVNFLATGTDRDYRPRAYYELAQSQYGVGDYAAALDSLAELRREFPLHNWPQAWVLRGDADYKLGNSVDAVLSWDTAWYQLPREDRELLVPRVEEAIERATNEERQSLAALVIEPEIRAMLPGSPDGKTGDTSTSGIPAEGPSGTSTQALLGEEQYAAGNRVDAVLHWEAAWTHSSKAERELLRPQIERAIDESSNGERQLLAQLLTEPALAALLPSQGEAAIPAVEAEPGALLAEGVRIAALLPLTGADQTEGRGALRGLRLAFSDAAAALVVRDTGSDAEMTASLLQSLAAETDVVAVIAALGPAEAKAVTAAAERLKVPLVLLSEQSDASGRFIHQAASSQEQKVRATITYARQHLAARRFAMLYPDNSYGRALRDPFRQEVLGQGGIVVGASPYPAEDGKPPAAIPGAQGWLRGAGVDAIFIPDSPATAATVAGEVHRTSPAVVFLGTDLWNDPAALAATGTALEGAVFAASFHADSALPSTQEFVDRFRSANAQVPTGSEAEAFDAAMLVRRTIGEGATNRQAMTDALRVTRTYEGGGRLSATAGGPRRDLFLLRVHAGRAEEVTAVAQR